MRWQDSLTKNYGIRDNVYMVSKCGESNKKKKFLEISLKGLGI